MYGGLFAWFFTLASDLIRMEKFLMMMIDKPDLAYRVLEKITDFFMQ